jgi:hypothetical protein
MTLIFLFQQVTRTYSMTAIDYLAVAFCILLGLGIWRQTKYSKLPPGPPASLFGNIHHIPRTESWKAYKNLAKTYGTAN